MKKHLSAAVLCLVAALLLLTGCSGLWFKDEQSKSPGYHTSPDEEGSATFILELRNYTDETEIEGWDVYPHSKIDGELIYSWEIPMYGNTVYESIKKFFEDREDRMEFRLTQHKFYMFHECTLLNGETYNLETVYVAADGVYSNCANYQSVLGKDGVAGTDDDLKVLTLVYKGWLY